MGKSGKTKKKCCRSLPRCGKCPVLQLRLVKIDAAGISGKARKKAVKAARAA